MSLTDTARGWATAQAQRLREDPRGWIKARSDQMRGFVDIAPFSDVALQRELTRLRGRFAGLEGLDADGRQGLLDDLLDLHTRLTPGGAMVAGAKIGLAAAFLPVVGVFTGPIVGSAYGVYRSQRLTEAREEVQSMLRQLARG